MNKEELIEKYFGNQLSDEEFGQLKKLIEEDEAFKSEFYHQLEIQKTIAEEKNHPIKERLKKLDKKPKKKNTWYLYAAAITILIVIGFLFYNPSPDLQEVYAENFKVYPNVVDISTRSEANNRNNTKEAFNYYDAGMFDKAASAFSEAYSNHPENYMLFYKGVSLLAQNEIDEGIRVLQSYNWEQDRNDFSSAANWYIGLAFLKQKQPKNAKLYLKKVVDSESNLSKQAQKLLKKLN